MTATEQAQADIGQIDKFVDFLRTQSERNVKSIKNGLRHYARLDLPPISSTPKDTVWQRDKVRLWRYRSDRRSGGPPLLLVHSLVNRSYIFDLVPGNSMVEVLLDRGQDVYLVEWGVPDAADAENSFETYCDDYLPEIVNFVVANSSADDLNMLGYCFGGVLTLLYAAGHVDAPLRSLTTLATPTDMTQMPAQLRGGKDSSFDPALVIDESGNVPGTVIGNAIRSLDPTAEFAARANLLANLWNDDYVAAHNAITQWGNDQIPFAGATFKQMAQMFSRDNGFMTDQLVLGGRRISLSDITVPFLNVFGSKDHIVPAAATRPLSTLVGSDEVTDLELPAGHVGLFIGRRAHQVGVPAMLDWIDAQ
ncbi:MAG: alpha/beta fold hydrolase [Acidimicrobiales bacterium]